MEELEMYIDREHIDIIAITETLSKTLQNENQSSFVLNGFNCITNNVGRGTALFVKDTLEITTLP